MKQEYQVQPPVQYSIQAKEQDAILQGASLVAIAKRAVT